MRIVCACILVAGANFKKAAGFFLQVISEIFRSHPGFKLYYLFFAELLGEQPLQKSSLLRMIIKRRIAVQVIDGIGCAESARDPRNDCFYLLSDLLADVGIECPDRAFQFGCIRNDIERIAGLEDTQCHNRGFQRADSAADNLLQGAYDITADDDWIDSFLRSGAMPPFPWMVIENLSTAAILNPSPTPIFPTGAAELRCAP